MMIRQVYRIDENGFYIEPVIIGIEDEVPSDCVDVAIPEGLYKPRFKDGQWVEGLTQEEIDAIRNAPQPETPEQKIARLESELAAAREENLTALEAIAELYEMLLAAQAPTEGGEPA